MGKLRGLLDSANETIGGLLGDFPAGFNSGALAGFAGWPGDMAYMADMARRAAMGERAGPAAQDFPGTTDYIAAKAGYPIPQSFSGQLGSMLGGMLSPSPTDLAKIAPVAAMFLGARAKGANHALLNLAQDMEKAGATADDIWRATGAQGQPWFKGTDGKWRFEISDNETAATIDYVLSPDVRESLIANYQKSGSKQRLGDVLSHEGMYASYPDMQYMWVRPGVTKGSYYPDNDAIGFGGIAGTELRGTGLHEAQHAIQQREGFASGGSPGEIAKRKDELLARIHYLNQELIDAAEGMDKYPRGSPEYKTYRAAYDSAMNEKLNMDVQAVQGDPFEQYLNLAGEAEARNVQSRMNMTRDERLNSPPWLTQDVPTDQQIVRFGDGPAMSIDDNSIKLLERNGEPINAAQDFAARRAGKAKPYQEALPMDQASRLERARGMGFDTGKTWYHGANRIDRLLEKPGLDPKRATSGPMPFFTDDPSVASNYASGKVDTSRLNEDVDYASWFKVKAGRGKAKNFTDSWYYLTDEERSAIKQNIGRIQQNEETGALEFGEGPGGQAHWDFALKQAYGNPLKAAKDVLLDSGVLYGDEEKFIEALKMAGLKHPVEYNSPQMTAPGILQAYARTSNPLDTSDKDALGAVLSQLEQASKGKRYKSRQGGVDPWDKNNIGIREFTERLKDDLNNGTTHAFTSIPDVVTEELRKMGYDAILDKGGKFTGQTHDVLIPFAPEQIRSVNAKFDPSKILSPDLLASMAALGIGTEAWREYQRQQNRKQGAQ